MHHIDGIDRDQITMFPEALDDYIHEDNPVRFPGIPSGHVSTPSLGAWISHRSAFSASFMQTPDVLRTTLEIFFAYTYTVISTASAQVAGWRRKPTEMLN